MARLRQEPQRDYPIDSVGGEPVEPTLEAPDSPRVDSGETFGSLMTGAHPAHEPPARRPPDEPERHELARKADPPREEP